MGTIRHRGVTLNESLIALLIFLIVSVGWISLEANLAKTSGDTQIIAQGVFVGQNVIDTLRLTPFDNLADSEAPLYFDSTGQQVDSPDQDGLVYSIDWTVTTPEDDETKRDISVNVSWNIENQALDTLELKLVRVE